MTTEVLDSAKDDVLTMLKLADPSVALSTEQAANTACLVAVIDSEVSARCGIVGAADRAPTVLRGQHPRVLSRLHAVMRPTFVVGVALGVFAIALLLLFVELRQILAGIFLSQIDGAGHAYAAASIMIILIAMELAFGLCLLTDRATLCARRGLMLGRAHVVLLLALAKAQFAGVCRATSVGVKIRGRFGFAADVAGFGFHRGLAVW